MNKQTIPLSGFTRLIHPMPAFLITCAGNDGRPNSIAIAWLTPASITAARDAVSALFGNSFDPIGGALVDLGSKSNDPVGAAAADHALAVAALSQLAKDLGLTLDRLLKFLVRDLSDGFLDGRDHDTVLIEDSALPALLAQALSSFVTSAIRRMRAETVSFSRARQPSMTAV